MLIRFVNRAFENMQYFCFTKTSVAHMNIVNTECFTFCWGGVLGGGSLWTWLQGAQTNSLASWLSNFPVVSTSCHNHIVVPQA